jgi:hypothetical protein
MKISICDRFPAMTPLSIRHERAIDVFRLVGQMSRYEKRKKKPKIIRRPAGDDWF